MAITPITKDDLSIDTRQLERNCPVNDKADIADIFVKLYNVCLELQDEVTTLGGTIAQPLPDILK